MDKDFSSAPGTSGQTPDHHRGQLQSNWHPLTKCVERSGGEVGCELVDWNKSHELQESGSYPGAQLSGLVSGSHGDLPFVKR